MCGRKLNHGFRIASLKLSAVLFLLLAVSLLAYSQENELTAEELNQPADLTLGELRAILSENESIRSDYSELNQKYQDSLIEHQMSLMKLEQEIALLKIESEIRMQSLETLKNETIWSDVWTFASGMILGYGVNELVGDIMETYENDSGGIF
jgi:hypothetical protein